MSIDVEVETLIPFLAARSAFPGNKSPGLATLHRWRLSGVRGVKLETCLVGGTRYTSREAISRFIAAQNATAEQAAPVETALQVSHRRNAAKERLDAELVSRSRGRKLAGAGC